MNNSVPAATTTTSFQAYNPNKIDKAKNKREEELHKLRMAYYQPALEDALAKRSLYKGVMAADPGALRQFAGMPEGASKEMVMGLINKSRGISDQATQPIMPRPYTPTGTPDAWTQGNINKAQQSAAMADLVGVSNPYTKKQSAAKGGIMQVKKYAKGGLTSSQKDFVKKMNAAVKAGKPLTQAQQDRLNTIEGKTGINVSPYTNTGTRAPGDPKIAAAAANMQDAYTKANPPAATTPAAPITPADRNPYNELGTLPVTYGVVGDPNDPRKPVSFTNPWVNEALNQYNQMQAPEQWGQASDMYRSTYEGLGGLTNYKPQDVAYQNASAERASAERATAAQMAAIKDVNAERVNLDQYRVAASQMAQPKDVQARELQRYQMGETAPITTEDLIAYQMAGPGSWTDEGVSSKYMSPYMQGVVDISKREAERDYLKQANALNAKAISAGAFGGSRQALERSEAQRNYNQQLQDIQTKGMQSAYESGRSQYGQELSLAQQAALQNLQSKLSTQSQSSQQELQAMLSNQNIDYQTKVQNLQSMLGVQSQEAQMMLNAALANQQTAFGTNQTNAQLSQQANLANQGVSSQGALANQQAALQAALANQQTQFGVGSLNANLMNQTNLQNASLGTQAALQNAQLGTQTNLANSQYGLQAAMANQQAGIAGAGINLNAFGAQQNAAQGLGYLGNEQAGYDQQRFGNAAQIAQYTQGLGQQYLDNIATGNTMVADRSRLPLGGAPGGGT